jgi:hypothetical protein
MAQKLYIVMHIPKTAGTTLETNFQRNFRGSAWLPLKRGSLGVVKGEQVNELITRYIAQRATKQTRCVFGHGVYYGIHKSLGLDVEPRYITFLRDPVERCISMYSWYKNTAVKDWGKEIQEGNWSIEKWFEKSKNPMRYNGQLQHLLLDSYYEAFIKYNCQSPHHLMDFEDYEDATRVPELTREHLEEGKRRLRQCWHVGLTESFDEDANYLYGKLNFWRFNPQSVVNAASREKDISSAARSLIAEGNALDIELYEYAKELREEFINKNAVEFKRNVNKARRRRSLFTAFPFIDPLEQQTSSLIRTRWRRGQRPLAPSRTSAP